MVGIFDPKDALAKETFVWEDESFSIPRAGGGSLRSITKSDLSEVEWFASTRLNSKRIKEKESQNGTFTNNNEELKLLIQTILKIVIKIRLM